MHATRLCDMRGFHTGIDLDGSSGHLVDGNRLDNNVSHGIPVTGINSAGARQRGPRHRHQLRPACRISGCGKGSGNLGLPTSLTISPVPGPL